MIHLRPREHFKRRGKGYKSQRSREFAVRLSVSSRNNKLVSKNKKTQTKTKSIKTLTQLIIYAFLVLGK